MFKSILSAIILFLTPVSSILPSETPPSPIKTIKISLGYTLDPCQGPILFALKHKLFEKHGLNIELIPASGGEEASRMVASKGADMGITKLPNHIVRVAKGMPLKRIATLVSVPLEKLITRPDLGDLKNLKGATIGFYTSNPDFSLVVLDKILGKQGLTRDDVNLIAFNQGMIQAFITGQIDAMITATDPHDTKLLEEKNIPFKAYDYSDFDIPPFEQFILFTHKDQQGESYLPRFMAALNQSLMMMRKMPHTAWQEICEMFPEMDTSLNFQIWMSLCHKFKEAPVHLDIEAYQKLIDFMNTATLDSHPLLKNKITLDEVISMGSGEVLG